MVAKTTQRSVSAPTSQVQQQEAPTTVQGGSPASTTQAPTGQGVPTSDVFQQPVTQGPAQGPVCTPEPPLVKYFDVLKASYGENAVRMAAQAMTGRGPAPSGTDVDSKQAAMIVQYFGHVNPEARNAAGIWLDKLTGALPAGGPTCLTPQNAKDLVKYFGTLEQSYGKNAVRLAAEAFLAGSTVSGTSVDQSQARMLGKYFDYLNNPPVVREAIQSWLAS